MTTRDFLCRAVTVFSLPIRSALLRPVQPPAFLSKLLGFGSFMLASGRGLGMDEPNAFSDGDLGRSTSS